MSWTTTVWSIAAGVCLALGLLHVLVWLRSRESLANLLFAVAAIAAGATAMQEAALMHAKTPAEYGEVMRWMHVSIAAIVIAMAWFIRLRLRAGRLWAMWLVIGLRALVVLVNFLTYPNATFREITDLRFVPWMGDALSIPVGEPSSWRVLINLSAVALLIYVLDAGVTAWRSGDRRRAVTLCGAISAVIVLSVVFSQLVVWQVLPVPLLGLTFLLIVLVIAFELSLDLIRAGQTARELRDNQERIRLATSGADVGIWEWRIDRDEVWVSDTMHDERGHRASGRLDLERSLEMVHGDDRERVRRALRGALESGREFAAEYRHIAPSGETRWIAARGEVVRTDKGQPILIRGVTHDITQRKTDEAQLLAQRSELAHVQRAYAIWQLSSALAHEMSQPLGAMLRNAEAGELFLQQNPPDYDELRSILTDIQRDGQRAAAVIDRMRAMLRRDAQAHGQVSVRELLEQVAGFVRAECQARHVVPRVEIPESLPPVQGDRVQLQQVALNLIMNALDAMDGTPADQRALVVTARRVHERSVEVAVSDAGHGVPAGQEDRLFEPFYSTKPGGLGMGLAISRAIIEAHGGRIWAESNPGRGTTICFTLQAAEPPIAA